MRRTMLLAAVFLAGLYVALAQGQAQPGKKEPLVDQVKKAINKGKSYLTRQQRPNGSWEINADPAGFTGGWSCLVMLALLEAGTPVDDPMMKSGLDYVRGLNNQMTYVVSLQTMVLSKAGHEGDLERINANVKRLIETRLFNANGTFRGWSYNGGGIGTGDGSNTQFAMLGLLAARDAGIDIPESVWKSIRQYYTDNQRPDGSWMYSPAPPEGHAKDPMTMTTAGLSGLLISGMEVKEGLEKIQKDGTVLKCGSYKDNVPVAKALRWLAQNFNKEVKSGTWRTFYNLYGIERAGRLSGLRFFGPHDWYREGCEYLVKEQHDDGSWSFNAGYDRWPIVSTSFALLFLSKGRTPVLISRAVHGAWPRQEIDTDWNADRNALRHLTAFASENLFKKVPLAWQAFDIQMGLEAQSANPNEEDRLAVTSELLQSPILFINGHLSPERRFTDSEQSIIQKYVENGGFVFAEACCDSPKFDKGFKKLAAQLWPDSKLQELPADHPVWSAHYLVPPGSFKLMGLESGCKTVLIYSPEDMSCRWEANLRQDKDVRGMLAFRMGANVIAYATGMEPPRPRLTEVPVQADKDNLVPPRGYLKVAQLRYDNPNWQPARRAIPSLMSYLRQVAGMDVALEPTILTINHNRLSDYKFLYMHGKGDPKLDDIGDKDLKRLKFNLETGGLLFADACCGNEMFDKAFRKFVARLFPKQSLQVVKSDDELFGKELNRKPLNGNNIRCRRERGGNMRLAEPYLEGIKINGRWALLYSKYDIGCALERHQSPDCLGYDYESARRIAGAAVLYLLRPLEKE